MRLASILLLGVSLLLCSCGSGGGGAAGDDAPPPIDFSPIAGTYTRTVEERVGSPFFRDYDAGDEIEITIRANGQTTIPHISSSQVGNYYELERHEDGKYSSDPRDAYGRSFWLTIDEDLSTFRFHCSNGEIMVVSLAGPAPTAGG